MPKHDCNIGLRFVIKYEKLVPVISHSLANSLDKFHESFSLLQKIYPDTTLIEARQCLNNFKYINTAVPNTEMSVSKIQHCSSFFFDVAEIVQICGLSYVMSSMKNINAMYLSPDHASIEYLFSSIQPISKLVSHAFDYDILYAKFIPAVAIKCKPKPLELVVCEFSDTDCENTEKYIKNLLLMLCILCENQAPGGIAIIKIGNVFMKAVIDIVFLLSGIYEKTYIVKPVISDGSKSVRYLVCKGFGYNAQYTANVRGQMQASVVPYLEYHGPVHSIVDTSLPYLFVTKLEDANIVIGQQQLDAYGLIVSIFKNRTKEEKMEQIKKGSIQKCITWCEKNQIPHNNFSDKVNVFLMPSPLNIIPPFAALSINCEKT